MSRFFTLSDEGRAVAVQLAAGRFVRITEVGEKPLPRFNLAGPALRRLVAAFMSLPQASRNIGSTEECFALVRAELS